MNKYAWSFHKNEDLWVNTCETVEECIKQATEERDEYWEKVYIGETQPMSVTLSLNMDEILESLEDQINDQVPWAGEMSCWCSTIKDHSYDKLVKELNNTLHKWLEETDNKPNYWEVINVEEYSL